MSINRFWLLGFGASLLFIILISAKTPNISWFSSASHEYSYWGRLAVLPSSDPKFSFPGVTIKSGFTGTSIHAEFTDFSPGTHDNYVVVVIDSMAPFKIRLEDNKQQYELKSGLTPGRHNVSLIKATESFVGAIEFHGLGVNEGDSLFDWNPGEKTIEFIGNSITCGYGNESTYSLSETGVGFHSENENNFNAWGYVAARKLGYKYQCVAYSGKGMCRNYDGSTHLIIPEFYGKTLPDVDPALGWDHNQSSPEIIVINAGTNDFAQEAEGHDLDDVKFKGNYISFVERLKGYHPNAKVVLAAGTMMSNYWPQGKQAWTRLQGYLHDIQQTLSAKYPNDVAVLIMAPQSAPYGEDWHPSSPTHQRMANDLISLLEQRSWLD